MVSRGHRRNNVFVAFGKCRRRNRVGLRGIARPSENLCYIKGSQLLREASSAQLLTESNLNDAKTLFVPVHDWRAEDVHLKIIYKLVLDHAVMHDASNMTHANGARFHLCFVLARGPCQNAFFVACLKKNSRFDVGRTASCNVPLWRQTTLLVSGQQAKPEILYRAQALDTCGVKLVQ